MASDPTEATADRPVLVETRSNVAWVTLNRPDRLNAMSVGLMETLLSDLARAADDDAVRCVVLTGAGRAFCAGGDAARLVQQPDSAAQVGSWLSERIRHLGAMQGSAQLLHEMPKPTICSINGDAVGGGLSLAIACDFRIASSTARFGTGYARMGISTDFGMSYFLPRLVGDSMARQLLFLPRLLDADEARALGMVDRIEGAEELRSAVTAFAKELAVAPTFAIGKIKENLALAAHASLAEVLRQEAVNARLAGFHPDAAEAVAAFAAKRLPNFKGR